MKKLILASAITFLAFGAFAQGNSGKNKKEKATEMRKEHGDDDDHKKAKKDKAEDRYDDMKDRRDDRRDEMKDRRDDRRDEMKDRRDDNRDRGNKVSKNTPRKVGDNFRRDFPNATNVSWTKNQGVWTATFNGTGLLGGRKTVSYKANGERVGEVTGRRRPSIF